jgi:hypothetical protein
VRKRSEVLTVRVEEKTKVMDRVMSYLRVGNTTAASLCISKNVDLFSDREVKFFNRAKMGTTSSAGGGQTRCRSARFIEHSHN